MMQNRDSASDEGRMPGQGMNFAADGAPPRKTHRLSVHINEESAETLRQVAAYYGINTTEAVRRAIGLLRFFEDERARGSEILVRDQAGEMSKIVPI